MLFDKELKKLERKVEKLFNVFKDAEEKHNQERNLKLSKFYFDLWREKKNFKKEGQKILGQLVELRKSLQFNFTQFCNLELDLERGRCKNTRGLFERHLL